MVVSIVALSCSCGEGYGFGVWVSHYSIEISLPEVLLRSEHLIIRSPGPIPSVLHVNLTPEQR